MVAISETAVAVVTVAAGKRTLRWFGDAPGKLVLGAVSAVDLVVGDRFAVVQTEKQVLAVALASGRKTVLGPSSATEPGGLAVDGGNAYWVENARGGGRVLQAALP